MTIQAQTSAFTYQGRFTDSTVSQPTNGTYSMTFRLYDAASGGNQIGSPVTTSVTVVNGIFSAPLDFGAAAFNTTGARFLEIQVGTTVLAPRQQVTSTPFATKAINAGAADSLSANCVNCVVNGNLGANSVTTSKVADGTVTTAKLADDAVSSVKILNGSIVNADISATAAIDGTKIVGSTITNLNASNLGTGIVPTARLGTGTANSTTFLRGDNTWATPASGATLQLAATNTGAQSIGAGTPTVTFNNTVSAPPAGSTFNGTTFTAGSAGLYLINVSMGGTGQAVILNPVILVNGTAVAYGGGSASANFAGGVFTRATASMVVSLAAGNTVSIQVASGAINNSTTLTTDGTTRLVITKLN